MMKRTNKLWLSPLLALLVAALVGVGMTATAGDGTGRPFRCTVTWPGDTGVNNRITVHYGYMEDGAFAAFDESAFSHGTPYIATAEAPNYLIYDVEGYDYAYTCLHSNEGEETRIQPILIYSGGTYRCFAEGDRTGYDRLELSAGNNIYVVYAPKPTPVQGGTATVYENSAQVKTLADVIVVYDVSGSMNNNMAGGRPEDAAQSRLSLVKAAVRHLANSLLAPEMVNREGQKLNRMALITFSNRAQLAQDFTSDPDVFNAAVDSVVADGGTNWEEALQLAGRLSVDPGRDTVVILISDGDPTFRMTRFHVSDGRLRNDNDIYTANQSFSYRFHSVFGQGSSDDQGRNYQAALTEASSIVEQGKALYTVAISDAVPGMALLAQDAGAGDGNSFTVQSEEALTAALDEIGTRTLAGYSWSGDPSQDDPAIVASGYCGGEGDGTNLMWVFDTGGTMTISGTGAMADYRPVTNYGPGRTPWLQYLHQIKHLVVQPGVTYIGNCAFYNGHEIEDVLLPDGLTVIGPYAFSGCSVLPEIALPESLTKIEAAAFSCSGLTALTIPDSVTEVEASAFAGCSKLTDIHIGSGLSELNYMLFTECDSLESVVIPDTVTGGGFAAFDKCDNLKHVTLSKNLSQIAPYMFRYTGLETVEVPGTVEVIGSNAYFDCEQLKSVTVCEGVREIEMCAFEDCTALETMSLPVSLELIGSHALSGCRNLRDIYYAGSKTQWQQVMINSYGSPDYTWNVHFGVAEPNEQNERENVFQQILQWFRDLFNKLFSFFRF